jgi:hypothetical protein
MGNRCIIKDKEHKDYYIYLQWNGGIESIRAFLDGAKRLQAVNQRIKRMRFDLFNFAVCIQNWFGNLGYSCYIEKYDDYVSQDNGNYIIDFKNLELVAKEYLNSNGEVETVKKDKPFNIEDYNAEFQTKFKEISDSFFEVNNNIFNKKQD